MLPLVRLNATTSPTIASVIWLHGLGADGHDFVPFVEQLALTDQRVSFVLPHAPTIRVTVNGGLKMPAWYDILSADFFASDGSSRSREDRDGIRYSQAQIEALVQHEVGNGILPEHVFLAGFSQGGAMALHTGLRFNVRLGGVLALSTYLPLAESLGNEAHPENANLPILMMHGQWDDVIPPQAARRSKEYLQRLGYPVSYHEFPMEHAVCASQIDLIREWVLQRLSPQKAV